MGEASAAEKKLQSTLNYWLDDDIDDNLGRTCQRILAGLENGGPAGLIHGFLLTWPGVFSQAFVMAEMGAMIPLAGGQYNWVSVLALDAYSKYLIYLTGWTSVIGWQATTCTTLYLASTMIQGLLIQHDSSYTPQRWHGCLIGYAILAFSLFINIYLATLLPKIESAVLLLHVFGFFFVLILWSISDLAMIPRLSSSKSELAEREDELRSLWAEILHTAPETVGIQHDFSNSGGDSLKAMALVSAARRRGINFSVAQLYQLRNIAELTKHAGEEAIEDPQVPSFSLTGIADVRQLRAVAAQQCDVDIELVQDMLPILEMQGFYLNRQRRQPCSCQVPLAFDLPLDIDMGRLQRAWEGLVAHHLIKRTRFIDTSYGTIQVILKHETIQWRSETSLAALLAAWETEDMSFRHRTHQSALLKATGQTPGRLMWYVNHAIVDQIMNEHIAQELSTVYEGQAVPLPKRRPFKSVVNHRLRSNRLRSQTFWRSHLKGAKYTTLFEGAKDTKSVACSKMTCEASIKIPEWLKISEYSIPVTAWAIAFARFAGVEDIPFFLIRAGRASTLPGSEDVMGPLLTRAPLRVSVKRDGPIVDLLRRVSCDIEESGNHELVREDGFRSVCGEAAEHLASGIYINFVPPSSGLTLSSDALFPVSEDVRDGLGYQTLPFVLSGELHYGSIRMDVTWDEEIIPRQSIQGLLNDFQEILLDLEQVSLDMTVDNVLSV